MANMSDCPPAEGLTDWDKCILCQGLTNEKLQCPDDSKRADRGAGYQTLAERLLKFHELGSLPLPIDINKLDDGCGLKETLIKHKAKWHKLCYIKFNTTQMRRAEKRRTSEPLLSRKFTRFNSESLSNLNNEAVCFFCDTKTTERLHVSSTFGLDTHVRQCALELQDDKLLRKLSGGDMVALDALYHTRCLTHLYNKADTKRRQNEDHDAKEQAIHGFAFAELISYIDDIRSTVQPPTIKLTDLVKLYKTRLTEMGITTLVHSTRLKNKVLAQFPDLHEVKQGRDVLLAFDEEISRALKSAYSYDEGAIILSKAAKIIRRDIAASVTKFDGSFNETSQKESVPKSLFNLIDAILDGTDIESEKQGAAQTTLTIGQLIVFNIHNFKRRQPDSKERRHKHSREPPLPMYLALKLHAKTRSRELVNLFNQLGISVSYNRVVDITTSISNRVCDTYEHQRAVCRPNIRHGLFTTAAVDNIDHNCSSTTSTGSFHGTGISMFQPLKSPDDGTNRNSNLNELEFSRKIKQLPEFYTLIPPVRSLKADAPIIEGPKTGDIQSLRTGLAEENRWLKTVNQHIHGEEHVEDISLAAYHASQLPQRILTPAISSLLPLFSEDSKSPSMIRHTMDIIKRAVELVNPGQVPVITLDQPLFSVAKQIQWQFHETHGEDRFVMVLGGLHIEMAGLRVIGDWLEDSGWTELMTLADIATSGRAQSFIKVSHVTRTRYAHQVSACALYNMLQRGYDEYTSGVLGQPKSFADWCSERKAESPHFYFWFLTMQLELLVLNYVRSLREGNFEQYKATLTKLVPWMFALDHTNYARWLTIHIRDMALLDTTHPTIAHQFSEGKFTVQRSQKKFSSIAIDQAHEQNNAIIKGVGGAIGLTQNTDFLNRWSVVGPEVARLLAEFEVTLDTSESYDSDQHHEQNASFQRNFKQHVMSTINTFEDNGNPFTESSDDLLNICSKVIAESEVVNGIRRAPDLGKEQYALFITERLEGTKSIHDSISKNKLPLFSRPPTRTQSKAKMQVSSLKSDCSLFSRLYITCQTREGDLDEFFCHENHPYPPALSNGGTMRSCQKSDLISCLEPMTDTSSNTPEHDAVIIDGAVIVNMLRPNIETKTFKDYYHKVFAPYIAKQMCNVNRVDVVWDQYCENSLKAQTRESRGKGVRVRVSGDTAIQTNWQNFLRINMNKTELFMFLADQLMTMNSTKLIITTRGSDVLTNSPHPTGVLAPCNHEEADTRLILHLSDCIASGLKRVVIRSVDTDVVVLPTSIVSSLDIEQLWIAFGVGDKFRYISIHQLAHALGSQNSAALPMFHSLTGCDTVSSFANRGKRSAWEVWKVYPELTPALLQIHDSPEEIPEETIRVLERYIVLLYNRTSDLNDINEARRVLFVKKSRPMDDIPPTSDALKLHILRAAYQGGYCWGPGQLLRSTQILPSPSEWGWSGPECWTPVWMTLPQASVAIQSLLKCGCKLGCNSKRCKCKKAGLACTALCQCDGGCNV